VVVVGILLWGISAISHPLMTRLQPKPAVFSPPSISVDLKHALPLQDVLIKHDFAKLTAVSFAVIDGKNYYRVQPFDNVVARYFSVLDGGELAEGDQRYAETLARHYTKRGNISAAKFLTEFDDDYHPVNRLLPVWRIDFDGDAERAPVRAYVDTEQSRLATLVDDTRHSLTSLFRFAHNWSFLQGYPRVQLWLMSTMLVALFGLGCVGIYLFFRLRKNSVQRLRGNTMRKLHRWLGLSVGLTILTFSASGFFHLLMSYQREQNELKVERHVFELNQLGRDGWLPLQQTPLARLALVEGGAWLAKPAMKDDKAGPVAQVAHLSGNHHETVKPAAPPHDANILISALNGQPLSGGVFALARDQAVAYARLTQDKAAQEVIGTEWVTRFEGEYGFLFKRLPVVKVSFSGPGNPRYYIEPTTGILSARVDDLDALEGRLFALLHKWTFFDTNKNLRDVLQVLFVLGIVTVSVMGLSLYLKRRKP